MWHLCFPSPLSSGSYLRGKILLWLFLPATTATYYISQCSGTKEVEEWTKTEGNLLHLTITFLDSSKCHELCYRLELHYIISPHSNFESHFMIVIFRTKKKNKKQVLGWLFNYFQAIHSENGWTKMWPQTCLSQMPMFFPLHHSFLYTNKAHKHGLLPLYWSRT